MNVCKDDSYLHAGMHATIKSFHGEIPSFFTVEEMIVKRLLENRSSFEAASYHRQQPSLK